MKKICVLTSVHKSNDVRIFYKEATSLAAAGFQVVLLAHDAAGSRTSNGVFIKVVAPRPRNRLKRFLDLIKFYKDAVKEKADAYHFHDPELLPIGFLLKIRTRKPVIYDSHENYPESAFERDWLAEKLKYRVSRFVNIFEIFIAKRMTAVITVVEDQEQRFKNAGCRTLRIRNYPILRYFPNPVRPWQERPIHTAYVGGLTVVRGLWTLLSISRKMKTILPGFKMLLIGPFSEPFIEKEAFDRIKRFDLQGTIIYEGLLPSEVIGERLQQAKLGLIPFEKNPKFEKMFIPTKLLEYMASGMPIVASDFPSNRRFVEKYSLGKLVPPGDVDAFVEAILGQLNDLKGSIQISKHGVEIARKNYQWENEAKKLIHFYRELLN